MAGRRKLGSASLKTGRLIWPCLAGERGPDGRGKWPYAIAEITKGSTVKYTDKTAKKGKKYYYKVRAVKANEAGVDVFSAYSAAKAVKVK